MAKGKYVRAYLNDKRMVAFESLLTLRKFENAKDTGKTEGGIITEALDALLWKEGCYVKKEFGNTEIVLALTYDQLIANRKAEAEPEEEEQEAQPEPAVAKPRLVRRRRVK